MAGRFDEPNLLVTFEGATATLVRLDDFRIPGAIAMHAHGAGNYELHWITAGNGQIVLDQDPYAVEPGNVFLCGPGVLHEQLPGSVAMEEFCLNFRLEGQATQPLVAALSTHAAAWLSSAPVLTAALTALKTAAKAPSLRSLRMDAAFRQVLIELADAISQPLPEATIPKAEPGRALAIEQYFLEGPPFSQTALADRLHLSARQLQRTLQGLYGASYSQLAKQAQLHQAALLLETTSRSVTAIASAVGYASTRHFSAAFSDYYHQTPSAYRKGRQRP